jgi:hypothetical protein
MQLGAEQRLVHQGRAAERLGAVARGVVQRLGGGLPPHVRVLVEVLGRARLVAQGAAELADHRLEVGARVGLERGEHLVDLHRARGLRQRQGVARLELGCARAPRLELHEEVALEEDARADLQLGVLVDRETRVVDLHRDHRRARVLALERLDALDLAHLNAGDPYRGARLDVRRVLEHGLQLVLSADERHVLREREVGHGHEEREPDRAGRERRDAACLHAPHCPASGCPLVTVPWLPGTFPITVRPVM